MTTRPAKTSILHASVMLAAACGGADPGDPGPDGDTSSPDAPRILTLDTNIAVLREIDPLVITAVVTDPDGIDDLIGGTLIDPDTGSAYGAFATSAAEGAYSITLSWGAIDLVAAIDAPVAGAPRRFRARFFDVAGHTADGDVTVTVRCSQDGRAACGGDCVDLSSSYEHCGACDTPVPDGAFCEDGVPGCAQGPESSVSACTDGCSNDGDSYVDCDDFNCCDVVQCPATSACGMQ